MNEFEEPLPEPANAAAPILPPDVPAGAGAEQTPPVAAPEPARSGRRRRLPLIALGLLLLVALILSGAGFAGYQAGLSQRDAQAQSTQSAELDHQYQLASDDITAGRYEVAEARFEYILQLDPGYRDAAQRLAQVRAAMAATATPTATPVPPTATALPADPTATESHQAADLFAQAQTQYAASDWAGVIDTLGQLHAVDSTYMAVKVNGMLYVAYRNQGVALIAGPDIEGGMFDLDKAQDIGPLDSEALQYYSWGRLYLAAQSYWGLNWQQTVEILQELYLIAPYFHDTNTMLYTATVNYADQLAASGDACGAAQNYSDAQTLKPDPQIADKLAKAQSDCALTPTTPATAAAETGTPGTPAPADSASATPHG